MVAAEPNPYESPQFKSESAPAIPAERRSYADLVPFLVWLPLSVVGAVLITPADPISALLGMAFGLFSFCMGYVLASRCWIVFRIAAAILWLPVVWVMVAAAQGGGLIIMIPSGFYAVFCFGNGYWACVQTVRGRVRILLSLIAGYVMGAVCVFYGPVLGGALGIYLARRSLPSKSDVGAAVQPDNNHIGGQET